MRWRVAALALVPSLVFAQTDKLDEKQALSLSQAAVGRALTDVPLVDQYGKQFSLLDMTGKPLVISLIYSSCYHTCPTMTKQLQRVVDIAQEALGEKSFRVLTVGFDSQNDTPQQMNLFAKQRGIDYPAWVFASGDPVAIKDLTGQLGFTYITSPRGFQDRYSH